MSLAANGYARLGKRAETEAALAAAREAREAREAVADDDPLDDVGGIFSVSLAKQHAYAASAYALLGDGAAADREATWALELYQQEPAGQRQPVNEGYAHTDVAFARVLGGELDGVGAALVPGFDLPASIRVDLFARPAPPAERSARRASLPGLDHHRGPAGADRELRGDHGRRITAVTAAPTTCHPIFWLQLTELTRVLEGVIGTANRRSPNENGRSPVCKTALARTGRRSGRGARWKAGRETLYRPAGPRPPVHRDLDQPPRARPGFAVENGSYAAGENEPSPAGNRHRPRA